jgi:hypothetical protein
MVLIVYLVKSNSRSNSKVLIPSASSLYSQPIKNKYRHNTILVKASKPKSTFFNENLKEKMMNTEYPEIISEKQSILIEDDDIEIDLRRHSIVNKIKGAIKRVKLSISKKSNDVKNLFKSFQNNDRLYIYN